VRRLVIAALLVVALSGCASEVADLEATTATELQTAVVAVAEPAAEGDFATSLAQLDDVQKRLETAIADGAVSAGRAASIQSAIDAVRADLELALTPEPEPEPTAPAPEPDPGKPGKGDKPEKPGKDR